uniref:NADH-ubiquinone oxidoreductase chain 4 n=1 Tax=Gefionella okellyi TaxID=2853422 RepID=A0A0B5H800_9EUKA|nr:NADH dehydrogenase subunit 4 [Gefionella okellyi]
MDLILIISIIYILILSVKIYDLNLELKRLGLTVSIIIFIYSIFLIIQFDYLNIDYQYVYSITVIKEINWEYIIGIDGISITFVLLTTFIIPICILTGWNIQTKVKEFIISFLLLELFLINTFIAMDLLWFYINFEIVLIPMFLIIGIWGSRERKIYAAFQFFLYTLFGSLFMLIGIILIYYEYGTTNFIYLQYINISYSKQLLLWILFFISFMIKIPMIPVHIWLPEAHVEAPTSGSIILAAILLKLGGYGLIRISLTMLPLANIYYYPLVYTIAIISIIYASLTTIRQIDLKKIIAYSSVAHMNYAILGLFTFKLEGIIGAILLMLSHGFVSTGLFFIIGLLYERHHSRIITYYSGLTLTMPILSVFFFLFTLSNMSLPLTSSFIGEFLILNTLFACNPISCIIVTFSTILGSIYAIWLYNRTMFGYINIKYINSYKDLNYREFIILLLLIIPIFIIGIYSPIVTNIIESSVLNLVNNINIAIK